ncbi:MAG: hypothetical protein ACXU81_02570 [Myxococcaceae bacterium]
MKMVVRALVLGLGLGSARAGAQAAGAAGGTQMKSSTAVTSSTAARSRFQRFASEELLPGLEPDERAEMADILRNRPSVQKMPCRDVIPLLGAGARLLVGTAAALDRPGGCWRLVYDGRLRSGLAGCLDAATGSVLAAWRIPEG